MFLKFYSVLLLFLSFVYEAQACNIFDPRCNVPSYSTSKDKFYIGGSLGNINLVGPLNRNLQVLTKDKTINLGQRATTPGLLIGYDTILKDTVVYTGIEVSYKFYNMIIEKEENTFPAYVEYQTKIENKSSMGFAGKLGFSYERNIFYMKAGFVSTKFKINFADKNNVSGTTQNNDYRKVGTMLGAGMDYIINDNWRAGVDYEYTTYSAMNLSCGEIGNLSYRPKTYAVFANIKYVF